MKRLLLCLMAMISMSIAIAQQSSHTVQRGETLESIAQKYNVSVAALKKANPDAVELFYVGMKLTIPNGADFSVQQKNSGTTTTAPSVSTSSRKVSTYNSSLGTTFEKEVLAGLSMSTWTGSDIKNANMKIGFHVGFAGRYFFAKSFFAESAIVFTTKGYKVKNPETTMSTNNIDVPINIGYRINLSDKMKLRFKFGPYITYAISGEMKTKGNSDNAQEQGEPSGGPGGPGEGPGGSIDGKSNNQQQGGLSSNSESSKIKLKDIKEYNTFNVGLNVGAAFDIGNFAIGVTYQRGLGQLLTKTKVYEQNILLTVGYKL